MDVQLDNEDSNRMPQLKSMYPADKYSLYSSDTEERILSVDQGLERCAAMLRSLLDDQEEDVRPPPCGAPAGRGLGWTEKSDPAKAAIKKGTLSSKVYDKKNPRNGSSGGNPIASTLQPAGVNSKPITVEHIKQHQQQYRNVLHHQPAACSTPNSKQGARRKLAPGPGPRNMKDPASGPRNMKDPAPGPRNMKDPAPGPRNLKDPAPGPRNMKDPAPGLRNMKDSAPGPRNMKDPALGPRTRKDVVPGPRNRKDTVLGSRNRKDLAPGLRNRKDEAAGPRNLRERRACSTPPPPPPPTYNVGGAQGGGTMGVKFKLSGSAEDVRDIQKSKPHRRARTELGRMPSFTDWRTGGLYTPVWLQDHGRGMKAERKANGTRSKPASDIHPLQLPPPPPPLFHPYYHPFAYPPPCLPPYPMPYYTHFLPPPADWPGEMDTHRPPKTQAEALDLATLHHPFPYPRGFPMDFYHSYYRDWLKHSQKQSMERTKSGTIGVSSSSATDLTGPATTTTTTTTEGQSTETVGTRMHGDQVSKKSKEPAPTAAAPPPPPTASASSTSAGLPLSVTRPPGKEVVDVEALDGALCELLAACEKRVQSIRTQCGSLLVGGQLEEVEQSLRQCTQDVHQHFTRLSQQQKKKEPASPDPSVTDLMAQIQQLEEERDNLKEKVEERCSEYSDVRQRLSDSEKQRQGMDKEVKKWKLQVKELQSKLDVVTVDFGKTVADLKMTEEEVASLKKASQAASKELKVKNAGLQEKIHSLFEEVSRSNREKMHLVEKLSCALEASKEEEQLLKLTIGEKNSQLLRAEDQLLGLRQCLAIFISELSSLDPVEKYPGIEKGGGGPRYCVPARAVSKLKCLADSGNIESFLAAFSMKSDKSSSVDSGGGGGETMSLSSSSTPTSPAPDEIEKINSIGANSPSLMKVITPLQQSMREGGSSLPSSSVSLGGSVHWVKPWAQEMDNVVMDKKEKKLGSSNGGGGGSGGKQESYTTILPLSSQAVTSTVQKSTLAKQSAAGGGSGYQLYPLASTSPSQSQSSVGIRSSITTASEIDFRNNLANLDADIARLQMQFKVAFQSPCK